jgi:hypothetical protein
MKNKELTFEMVQSEIPVKYLGTNLEQIKNNLSSTDYNGLSPKEILDYSTMVDLVSDLIRLEKKLSLICVSEDEDIIKERNNAFEVLKIKKLDLIRVISNL